MLGLMIWAEMARAGGCPERVDVGALETSIHRAVERYAAQDRIGFEDALQRSEEQLPCVGGKISLDDSAQVQFVEGLKRWSAGDRQGARPYFEGAARLTQSSDFAANVVTIDPDLSVEWEEVSSIADVYEQGLDEKLRVLPRPEKGYLVIDGLASRRASMEFPHVLQHISKDSALESQLLAPDERSVPYIRRSTVLLTIGGAVTALIGGWITAYSYNWYRHSSCDNRNGRIECLAGDADSNDFFSYSDYITFFLGDSLSYNEHRNVNYFGGLLLGTGISASAVGAFLWVHPLGIGDSFSPIVRWTIKW